ncbi:hypothetical protein APHAL10511_007058 [Amanita phalloides]|nr:hypothetical protein APHAL10511_007058 [Amanita phalloides]
MATQLPADFEWRKEYQLILECIASDDSVNSEELDWNTLRNVVKYYIEKNISGYLLETKPPEYPHRSEPVQLPGGGLKLPPFLPRKSSVMYLNETPVSYMNEQQAKDFKQRIFDQLHEFEKPPFTIQRLCELCLYPRNQYKSIGKYLRAVEKSILVTSTWDSFPILADKEPKLSAPIGLTLSAGRNSTPATPLFSPIPFLHEDARRSKSRSPPPSPLVLSTTRSTSEERAQATETKALGLVDELDDPRPGHLSDQPKALSSVTTVSEHGAQPLVGSLEDRFIKSNERHEEPEEMKLDRNEQSSTSTT